MESIESYKKALEYIFSLRKPRQDYTPARIASHSDAGGPVQQSSHSDAGGPAQQSSLNEINGPGIHIKRLSKFLEFIDNPHLNYPVIHVGGTAGKGSVTYLIASILKNHGLKVGMHTSPYMIRINEKFQINQKDISDVDFVNLTKWLETELESFERKTDTYLTYYESIVAMVFKHYSSEKVDVAVIEVGMGGKFDATNVVKSDVAVLTNVGLDHMEFLGDTKEKILLDKVEIMKPEKTFITGVKEPALLEIIETKAKEKRNKLFILNNNFKAENIEIYSDYSTFNFRNANYNIDMKLSLSGIYQVENACMAIQACIEYLKEDFDETKTKQALSKAFFAGRMQTYSKNPLVIIDGAHNQSKMEALADSLNTIYPNKEVKILLSVKKGKNLDLILNELVKINFKEIIITEFSWDYYDKLESIKAEELKEELLKYLPNNKKDTKITIIKDSVEAFENTKKNTTENELMLVTGSLYLIGSIFSKIKF